MKPSPRRRWLLLLGFTAVFLATRLPGLTRLPVFLDEAIHIEWATKVAETGRVLGISDGGRYLPIWLWSLVAAEADDPLRAARTVSVAWGLATALGLVVLGRALYTEAAGWLAAGLYTVLPSTLLYDRMALVESAMGALVVAALAAAVRWADTGQLGWAVAAGALIGLGAITKLYGALLLLLPLLLVALRPRAGRHVLRPQVVVVQAVALAVMLPVFLDLGPSLAFVRDNVWFLRERGTASYGRSAAVALLWTAEQLTPLGFALILLAILHGLRRREAADGVVVTFWLSWTALFVATGGRDWFPRYLLPGLIPSLLLAANRALRTGEELAGPAPRPLARVGPGVGLLVLFAAGGVPAGRALLADPASAPMVAIDRWQYVQDWPSGYRLDDVARFLAEQAARKGGVLVVRDQRSGPLLEGLNLLFRRRRSGVEFVDLYLHKGALASAAPRLLADPRPVLLAIQEPLAHHLVLSFAGRLAPLLSAFAKPSRSRHFEVYCLAGDCEQDARVDRASLDVDELGLEAPKAPPPGLDSPRALEQARLCMLEDGERSVAACRRALAEGLSLPRAAEVHYSAGRNFATRGLFREAAVALREAVRLLPDDAPLALAFVENLETLGQDEQALEVARDVLRYAPHSAAALGRVGYNLARLGRLEEAAAALEHAVAVNGGAGALNDLGVVLFLLGRNADAEAAFRDAAAANGEGLRQRVNLSMLVAARARSGP
jgi:tetratricopeptide (TPR) repeat protein